MNKIVLTKKTSAIFLAIVLVVGTFALSFPSFIVGAAQATSDRDKDYDEDDEKSYDKDRDDDSRDYEKDNDDKKSYSKDRNAESTDHEKDDDEKSDGNDNYEIKDLSYDKDDIDKSKDSSSVLLKKVKCNNINVNVNGLELDVFPPVLSGLASEAQGEDEGEKGVNSYGSGERSYGGGQSDSDIDFKFVCINNNDNSIIGGVDGEEPTTGTLKVTKEVTCEDNTQGQLCEEFEALITEDQFLFQVTGNNPDPSSQFPGSSTGTDVTLGSGNYVVTEAEEEAFENIDIFLDNNPEVTVITGDHSFTGDCTQFGGGEFLEFQARGTIAAGESQTCNAINAFTID